MEKELIQQQRLLEFQPKTSLCFISKGRVLNVKFDEITHVSRFGDETMIYTADTYFKACISLKVILNDLPMNEFFRVHRSHIISLKYMTGVKRKRIVVGEYHVLLSKCYKIQFSRKLAMLLERGYDFFYEKV